MGTRIYMCSECRAVTADGSRPASCVVFVNNGEAPSRCVCGDVAPDWSLVKTFGDVE